ncbi:hypothetical protein [Shimia sp. MIT910701]|uniref:hypothetical protein n=1 Tax=Shimia sp. MIT910701 TaxID=3096987 RepID=UPI003999B905
MFHRLALPVTLLSLAALAACGNPQTTSDRSARAGPQAQSPITPGPNNTFATPGLNQYFNAPVVE